MKFITVSELRLRATQIVKEVERTKEDVVVTKNGKPKVMIRFIDDTAFEFKKGLLQEPQKEDKKWMPAA